MSNQTGKILMESRVKFKVIFFDFGDTLVHFKNSVYVFWAKMLIAHGFASQSVKVLCKDIQVAIRKEWAIRNGEDITWVKDEETEREYWRAFYESILGRLDVEGVPEEVISAFIEKQMDPESWELFDDVIEALNELKKMGFKLGIISNAFPSAKKYLINNILRNIFYLTSGLMKVFVTMGFSQNRMRVR